MPPKYLVLAVHLQGGQRAVQTARARGSGIRSAKIGVELRPIGKGIGNRGCADAAGGMSPLGAPFVRPSGILRQDLDRIDAVRLLGGLIAHEEVVARHENRVVGIFAEKVGERIAISEDDVQREAPQPHGTTRRAAAGERLLDPLLRRRTVGNGGVNTRVETADDFFLFLRASLLGRRLPNGLLSAWHIP